MSKLLVSLSIAFAGLGGATQVPSTVPEIAVTGFQDRPREWARAFRKLEAVEVDKVSSVEAVLNGECVKVKERGIHFYFETRLLSLDSYVADALLSKEATLLFGTDFSKVRKIDRSDGRIFDKAIDLIGIYVPNWEKSGAKNSYGEIALSPLLAGALELNGKKIRWTDNRPFEPGSDPKAFTPSRTNVASPATDSQDSDPPSSPVRVTPVSLTVTSPSLVTVAGKALERLNKRLLELAGVQSRLEGIVKDGKAMRLRELPDWKREIIESSVMRRFKEFGFESREAASGSLGSMSFSESFTGFAVKFKIGGETTIVEISNPPR